VAVVASEHSVVLEASPEPELVLAERVVRSERPELDSAVEAEAVAGRTIS